MRGDSRANVRTSVGTYSTAAHLFPVAVHGRFRRYGIFLALVFSFDPMKTWQLPPACRLDVDNTLELR